MHSTGILLVASLIGPVMMVENYQKLAMKNPRPGTFYPRQPRKSAVGDLGARNGGSGLPVALPVEDLDPLSRPRQDGDGGVEHHGHVLGHLELTITRTPNRLSSPARALGSFAPMTFARYPARPVCGALLGRSRRRRSRVTE